jgi:hypothetical protein
MPPVGVLYFGPFQPFILLLTQGLFNMMPSMPSQETVLA